MGIKQIVTDDLTGVEIPSDTETTEVTVDGKDYTLYLSPESKETFIALCKGEAPLLENTKSATTSSTKAKGPGGTKVDKHGHDFKDVLAWAIANGKKGKTGKTISETTKVINQDLYDEYHAEQSA